MKELKKIPSNMTEAETKTFLQEVARKLAGKDLFPEKTAHARDTLNKMTVSIPSNRKA